MPSQPTPSWFFSSFRRHPTPFSLSLSPSFPPFFLNYITPSHEPHSFLQSVSFVAAFVVLTIDNPTPSQQQVWLSSPPFSKACLVSSRVSLMDGRLTFVSRSRSAPHPALPNLPTRPLQEESNERGLYCRYIRQTRGWTVDIHLDMDRSVVSFLFFFSVSSLLVLLQTFTI